MKIVSSRTLIIGQTDRRRLAFTGLLSEPKILLRFQDIFEIRREMKVPLSMCFTAYKDDEYFGKGEENLKFSGCSLNTKDIMDPK